MQADLETLGRLERRLSVAVPVAEIDTEVENRLKRLSRTVKMHGFRPGKVPFKVVAQQFGSQVRQEVLGDTLGKSFGEAVRQRNLRVAGYPRFEAKPLAEGASEFEYSVTFEVYPDIAVGNVSQVTIARPQLEVGEAEVDKTIEIMRRQRATFVPVDRTAENGDRLTISYRGTVDDKEFSGSSTRDYVVVLGGGRLLPDFDKQLVGMKAGQAKTFEVCFPHDYHGKDVAGKTARFAVTVTRLEGPKLPAVDTEFAKSLGVADGDLSKMRREVKTNLEREVGTRLRNRVKEQAMQALLDVTRIEVPKSLVDLEIQRLQKLARTDLAARGVQVKDGTPIPAEVFEKQAERRVRLGLILAEVVKAQKLHARPEQVRSAVEDQAQSYERPEEVVKWCYQSPERLRDIESAVVEDNIVAWVVATAKVEDRKIAFEQLMGNQQ